MPTCGHAGSWWTEGVSDVDEVLAAFAVGAVPDRALTKVVVKESLALLVAAAPGRSVEVRIPPYAVVQAVGGAHHRRGTPPAVVECDARTWLELATGALAWTEAVTGGRVRASGERSDLSPYLPLYPPRPRSVAP